MWRARDSYDIAYGKPRLKLGSKPRILFGTAVGTMLCFVLFIKYYSSYTNDADVWVWFGMRSDGRCGKDFGTEWAASTTCGKGHCCSSHGWCGHGEEYCSVALGCQSGCYAATEEEEKAAERKANELHHATHAGADDDMEDMHRYKCAPRYDPLPLQPHTWRARPRQQRAVDLHVRNRPSDPGVLQRVRRLRLHADQPAQLVTPQMRQTEAPQHGRNVDDVVVKERAPAPADGPEEMINKRDVEPGVVRAEKNGLALRQALVEGQPRVHSLRLRDRLQRAPALNAEAVHCRRALVQPLGVRWVDPQKQPRLASLRPSAVLFLCIFGGKYYS